MAPSSGHALKDELEVPIAALRKDLVKNNNVTKEQLPGLMKEEMKVQLPHLQKMLQSPLVEQLEFWSFIIENNLEYVAARTAPN